MKDIRISKKNIEKLKKYLEHGKNIKPADVRVANNSNRAQADK